MTRLEAALIRVASDLTAIGARWALVGAMAVGARAEPRMTKDVDLAIAVSSEEEGDRLIRALHDRGYRDAPRGIRLRDGHRIAVIRLLPPGQQEEGVVVDFLFDLTRIEREVVEAAERLVVVPGLAAPVARTGHLMALKVLSAGPERPMDSTDFQFLLQQADDLDLDLCRRSLELISRRGGDQGQDLRAKLQELLDQGAEPAL